MKTNRIYKWKNEKAFQRINDDDATRIQYMYISSHFKIRICA